MKKIAAASILVAFVLAVSAFAQASKTSPAQAANANMAGVAAVVPADSQTYLWEWDQKTQRFGLFILPPGIWSMAAARHVPGGKLSGPSPEASILPPQTGVNLPKDGFEYLVLHKKDQTEVQQLKPGTWYPWVRVPNPPTTVKK